MVKTLYILLILSLILSCTEDDNAQGNSPQLQEDYYPPSDPAEWKTVSLSELDWNEDNLFELYDFLEQNNTRAFIVLKDGKIAVENYWGNTITNSSAFDENSIWYWASAGKTLTATLAGIAQEEGHLTVNDKTSDYLGTGWTSLDQDKEDLITIHHQLTMTTGLDYSINDLNCTMPSCLSYKEDAGNQWFYHNAPYTLIQDVISNASNQDYNEFTNQNLELKIGMNGEWISNGFNSTYWSTARDMARFGLLISRDGIWEDTQVINDQNYLQGMISSSQNLNPSYGYLWWLNGKNSIIFPGLSNSFEIPLASNAPEDLVAGMGKNGQFVEVIPSLGLVVIRMGEAPDESLVPIQFHNQMWAKIIALVN